MVKQPIAFEHFEEALRSKEEGVWCKGEVMRLYEQYILNAWGGQIVLGLANLPTPLGRPPTQLG
ncbi:hypothetical protein TVAG_499840 [Trichomonas vaginalis G3]|uniref:Uncharacterized protein n=1 Tax=Trichomonas vaginalis (strain ATCC PRA-98 / G3) TaxID=412133 RepID=A2GCU0_TRIV3|nr:hypothetical protein TVAG_499840 [Trichomonas vaginalis G3]|eukprot:XP_001297957.1 hypothetical protein [Trichomonas vaginalis G3]